ncbi:hypothetical protein PQX77_018989, partial [Marasmius sp. AFHP31]
SSLENLALSTAPASKGIAGVSADEPQREKKAEQVGLGTKPLDDTEMQGTDTAPSDPTSANEGVLPQATDKDEGGGKVNTTDSGAKTQTPVDGTETDNPTGNKDTAEKASVSVLLMGFNTMLNCVKNPQDPTLEKSWEVIMKEVTALDEGLVAGWKEDLDTLLVFAGLFSAVVTAFTIESYKWLQEAPEDTTVALLKQISQQLNGSSVAEPDEFTASSSNIIINTLWFMSLVLALVVALFALLCKQWLREHRRHTHTRTPSEALALRWLRNQSLEGWGVPTILAALPILLELALFLFLLGLLGLLLLREALSFAFAMTIVGTAGFFYIVTTIIPALTIIRQARQVTWQSRQKQSRTEDFERHSPGDFIMTLPPMEYICPFKSPQAWVVFKYLVRKSVARDSIIGSLSDWSSVDLELLQRSSIDLAPPFYELNAFRWLVAELRDSPHMIPHLRNILSTIPLHLVMPAVLDQWFFLPGRKWTVSDIDAALDPSLSFKGIEGHLTDAKRQILAKKRRKRFTRLLHWTNVSMNGGNDSSQDSPPPFSTPFESTDANPDNDLCGRLWGIYTEIVQSSAPPKYYWAALMEDLAPYIIASSPDYALHEPTTTTTSSFVKSTTGYEFLSKMHDAILEGGTRGLYTSGVRPGLEFFNWADREVEMTWTEAMDIVRRVHEFPEDHFRVIPGHFSLPLSKLRKTLNSLSPKDPEIDFGYLDLCIRGWGYAAYRPKVELVKILSEHINKYPQSDTESSRCPDKSNISPLVMSSAGLELITFVNNRLAEEPPFGRWRENDSPTGSGWRDAIGRVRAARPELPPDHFKNIPHEETDSDADERPSQQGAEVGAQEGDLGGSPRDVTNAGEVGHDIDETNRRSNLGAEPLPKLEPGERGPLVVENAGQEGIPREPIATGHLASDSTSSPVQGTTVGGPDADKNV